MGYLSNFIVYTFAMTGLLCFAIFIFKRSTSVSAKGSAKILNIVDSMSLGGRKTLYVVSAGKEKFLIAGDTERTALISKLDLDIPQNEYSKVVQDSSPNFSTQTFKDIVSNLPKKQYTDKSIIGIHSIQTQPCNSVMKNLAEKMR